MLALLREDPSAEDAKLAAVLYDHLETMLHFNDVHIESLIEQKDQLGTVLTQLVQQQTLKETQLQLSDTDQLQLSRILKSGLKKAARIPIARLIVIFFKIIRNRILQVLKSRKRTINRKLKR